MPPGDGATRLRAQEAWSPLLALFSADKPRRLAVITELGLSFQQAMALMHLDPGGRCR